MSTSVLILGAGFGGLELATRLSESVADEVEVTLIDRNDAFYFGYSKLDVLFRQKSAQDVLLPYADISLPSVEFRQESVVSIEPESRRVTTDRGTYEPDFVVVALGADYDFGATPGFAEGGVEYYTLTGAERMRDALPAFSSGTIVVGILGHPFKCPPAPFEGALLLHDHLVGRGIRDVSEIRVLGPTAAPVPVSQEVSQSFVDALAERGMRYEGRQNITEIDAKERLVRLETGEPIPYELFVGIPVHRVPTVVAESGLAPEGWVTVDRGNLATPFDGIYAIGDVAGAPVAKAGVFAESAAAVVADAIVARLRGEPPPKPWDGVGSCFIEFGDGAVAKVEANFLGGPSPTARLVGPSVVLAAEKDAFGAARRARWFGRLA